MFNESITSILRVLLRINLIIYLSACQSANIINNGVSNDNLQLDKRVIAPINSITGKVANMYTKESLKDYVGDLDKKSLAMAIQKAANTDQPHVFINQESGVKGKAEVIQSRTLATQETGKKDSVRKCKTIRQTIILKDKREIIESVVLCKGPDGWS